MEVKHLKNKNILSQTRSLCPICFEVIDAKYINKENDIFLQKNCTNHGDFETLIWKGLDSYENWTRNLADIKPEITSSKVDKGCPFDCGLCPNHKQHTCCVLLEVTSKCNLKCPICFASANENIKDDPTLEEINNWYDELLKKGGPFSIQLSGGEPTLRDDLDEIIKIGKEKGFDFFQVNTNGIRIAEDKNYLKKLVHAGLTTVFLQFDGFEENTYNYLRGKNLLDIKLKAIENCKDQNVGIILVPTLRKNLNNTEIGKIIDFALENMPYVRGVHIQPMSFIGRYKDSPKNEDRLTIPEILKDIEVETNDKIKMEDFSPGNAEHFLCSFHANFVKEENGTLRVIKSKQTSCCSGTQVKNVVARKWKSPNKDIIESLNNCSLSKLDSFDKFLLDKEINMISISGMCFQDIWNVDLDRLQRCYLHELGEDINLVPFCIFNMTDINGNNLYRNKK